MIDEYSDRIDICYHRFSDNLGAQDLVAQWERCISLIRGEQWIWLFSDDDVMGRQCVEMFYNEIDNSRPLFDLYHFNINVINSKGDVIKRHKKYPQLISSEDFYRSKASARLESFVVEYIFSRSIYENTGGFVNFDWAWGSDIATWVRMGRGKGIKTINGDIVYWRKREKNITPDMNNNVVMKKALIEIECFTWMNNFFGKSSIHRFNEYAFFRNIFHYSNILTKSQNQKVLEYAMKKMVVGRIYYIVVQGLYYMISITKSIKG